MVEVQSSGEGGTGAGPRSIEKNMNNAKTFITWLLMAIVCAGGTILGVQMLDKPLGLRQKAVNFGQPKTP
jgi:hypothetical protein